MPNRADHTVNSRPLDRSSGINSYALSFGIFLAVLAALTVILMGETLGLWLGISILTILIFFQIFWRFRAVQTPKKQLSDVTETKSATPNHALFENDPIVLISVSPLGRVRAISGNVDLLPGLKVGSIVEDAMPAIASSVPVLQTDQFGPLAVRRLDTSNGHIVLIAPETDATVRAELSERTRFFAGMGHDLKSPLNGIIGFADIMAAGLKGPLPEAYTEYPALIREGGETLLRLIEDMLGYAKAEAGTYELDPAIMDIAASGESVMRQSQAVADLAGVTLRFHARAELLALADAAAVRRIWDNLVSNAIKYSSSGDTVTLRAFERDGFAFMEVIDTGAGMHAEDLARIAKPFAQGENAKGRAGTGLGLAMVQKLAELQGGQVTIRTAPGQGTTVTVRLPVAESEKRAAE